MKEIKEIEQDEIKNVRQKQEERKTAFLGSMRYVPGLTIFELNLDTGNITKAEIKVEEVFVSFDKSKTKRSLIKKENCIYIQALNEKNAKRKILNTIKR